MIGEGLGGEDLAQVDDVSVLHFLPHVDQLHALGVGQTETCRNTANNDSQALKV